MKLTEITAKPSKYHETAWGYLLSIDCRACDKSVVTNKKKLEKFILGLVQEIGMKAHGKMSVDHFPNRDPGREGLSLVQLIETSSITGHFVDKTGDGYIDIFSCKDFSSEDAMDFVKKHLNPKSTRFNFVTRNA